MHLESSEGLRANITESQLARLLERPAPLIHLHGPGIALLAIHSSGSRFTLMHWNGRTWSRALACVDESSLSPRFIQFLKGGGAWREGLTWETVHSEPSLSFPLALPAGLHVLVTFLLVFGGFAAGALLGIGAGRYFATHAEILVYIFAVLFAPPLAILGQHAAVHIPSACAHCDERVINLQTGRFAYLCTECGHVNITRWGIHRGPMAP